MNKKLSQLHKKAFTLIELVIVLAVVGTLTAATIPTFNGITSTQNLKRSVDDLTSDIQLVKDKSISGITDDNGNTDIVWGIQCEPGTSEYSLGYAEVDNNGNPGDFVSIETRSLDGDTVFTNPCDEPVYFERLTGDLYGNLEDYGFNLRTGNNDQTSVHIQKAGKVSMLKEFCGDGIKQDNEDCDVEEGGSPPNVASCEAGYDESCSYCTDKCEVETIVGPRCGDGIKQDNEACDIVDGGTNPNVGIDACSGVGYGNICDYCTSSCTVGHLSGGTCGDGIYQAGSEECDLASGSPVTVSNCEPSYNGTCSYCDIDNGCKIKTKRGGYCGNGSVDRPDESCDASAPANQNEPYNISDCNAPIGGSCTYCNAQCETRVKQGEPICNNNRRCEANRGETRSNCSDCVLQSPCNRNGRCDLGENASNCPSDCRLQTVCNNNGRCDLGENTSNCPGDCRWIRPIPWRFW